MNKVWTFVIGKPLTASERANLENEGNSFVRSWTAHDNPLDASFEIVKERLILVKVNQAAYAASGCSIDKLTRFIKKMSDELGTDLLDRQLVAFETNSGEVKVVKSSEIGPMLASGELTPGTPVFDNTIADEYQLKQWRKPLEETWLNRFLQKH